MIAIGPTAEAVGYEHGTAPHEVKNPVAGIFKERDGRPYRAGQSRNSSLTPQIRYCGRKKLISHGVAQRIKVTVEVVVVAVLPVR